MFRKKVANNVKQQKDRIRWRGHEVTRIEAFSDAVFAFAITLLIVSLEVPKDYEEMIQGMKSFIPFAMCFAMLFQVWITQNVYFRRYGMHDETTIILNAILLFVVLFFVYPLKFLFNTIFFKGEALQDAHQVGELFLIYSAGFTTIYLLFTIMYYRAWFKQDDLELTQSEVFETKTNIYCNIGMTSVGAASMLIAYFGGKYTTLAWLPYVTIGLVLTIIHSQRGKQHRKLYEQHIAVQGAAVELTAKELEKIPDDKLN